MDLEGLTEDVFLYGRPLVGIGTDFPNNFLVAPQSKSGEFLVIGLRDLTKVNNDHFSSFLV